MYAAGFFDECKSLCQYLGNFAYWSEILECGHPSSKYRFMKTAQSVLKSTREKFVVVARDGDDPSKDDDSKCNYDFKDVNWGKTGSGFTRFAAHNIMEFACDALLYVDVCSISIITFTVCQPN